MYSVLRTVILTTPHPISDTLRHFQVMHINILPHISTPGDYRQGEVAICATEQNLIYFMFLSFEHVGVLYKKSLHIFKCKREYFLNSFLESKAPLPPLLSLCLYPLCSISLSLSQILPVLPHIPKQYAGGPCSHRPEGTYVLFLELTPSAHARKVKKEKSPPSIYGF